MLTSRISEPELHWSRSLAVLQNPHPEAKSGSYTISQFDFIKCQNVHSYVPCFYPSQDLWQCTSPWFSGLDFGKVSKYDKTSEVKWQWLSFIIGHESIETWRICWLPCEGSRWSAGRSGHERGHARSHPLTSGPDPGPAACTGGHPHSGWQIWCIHCEVCLCTEIPARTWIMGMNVGVQN